MIPKKVRRRAAKALKTAALDLLKTEHGAKCTCNCTCRTRNKVNETEPPVSKLTPEMKNASILGRKMVKQIFFPSIPAVLQDIWVYTELGITLFAFIFGLFGLFPIEENTVFQVVYLVLTIISIIFALIDANIYFFQLGSLARAIRVCRRHIKKGKDKERSRAQEDKPKGDSESENETEKDGDQKMASWYRWSEKRREIFSTWFEIIRTVISELLLYPLLIFDLFDFVTEASFRPESNDDRVNFSLFVVGGFYLILAVYVMRIFMVAGALSSLVKIPIAKNSKDGGKYINVVIRFCIHIIGQIVVHLMILFVIGAKIANENIDPEMTLPMNATNDDSGSGLEDQSNTIRASAFLAVAIAFGGVIPLIGIIMFFVANYYWMQEFSIGFFVNSVALLQGQGFAETVFGGEGTAPSKELAQSFAKKVSYKTVKKQLRRFKSPPFHVKFFLPIRVPLAGISTFIYGTSLVIFIISLTLTTDANGNVSVAVFKNDSILSAAFVTATLCIIVANIHILVLFAIGVAILLVLSIIALPAITLLLLALIFIYIPLSCYTGTRRMASDIKALRDGEETNVFHAGATSHKTETELDSCSNDSGHNSSNTGSV